MFYPADPGQCSHLAESYIRAGEVMTGGIGGVVPHAGWICSGAIAGEVIATLAKETGPPDLVVVFGAVHTPIDLRLAALASHDAWRMPGGDCPVARDLAELLERSGQSFATDDRFHGREHAVEVEI